VKVVKVNVDESVETPGQYSVMSIPTFIIFKGGQPVSTFLGAKPKEHVKRELDRVVG
jgi:thioredoxin 1